MAGWTRRRFSVAAAAAAGLFAPLVQAQEWPSRTITIVVPYAAGGATDAVARLLGQRLQERLKQTVIVDNKPGGSSNIGMGYVAKAEPDGYTWLLVANSLVTNNSLFANLPFDGLKDFAPLGRVASAPLLIAVPADSPFRTLKELIDQARAAPGQLTYASPGNGSSAHLAGESFKQQARIDALHVPYKGAAPAMTDLIGGRISFMPINTVEAMGHLRGKRVRALAIAATQRIAQLPDVPTAAEAGLPAYLESVWYGLAAPAGVPPELVQRINAAMQAVIAEPAVMQKLVDLGATPAPGGTAQFAAFLSQERERTARVVRLANIRAD